MSNKVSTASGPNPTVLPFSYPRTGSSVIYALPAEATANDLADHLEARLQQLDAMLTMTYGDGGEAFRRYNDDIQECYLWACSGMAGECLELLRQLSVRMG